MTLCRICAGTGEADYPATEGEAYELRTCETCWGSGVEHVAARVAAGNAGLSMDRAVSAMGRKFGEAV